MKIFFGADHAGFFLKEKLVTLVRTLGFSVEDLGAHEFNEEDDYPDFIAAVAAKVSASPREARGIVLGGSGEGEAIAANRFPGVRAVVYYGGPIEIIALSRLHNDANILSLGARFVKEDEAIAAVREWLSTTFPKEERHVRRIEKIERLQL